MRAVFRSLTGADYRLWTFGTLLSNLGHWTQLTAQSWVVLTVLTDNDAAAMGLVVAMQFAPPLVLLPITGWVIDRFPRRSILLVTQSSLLVIGVSLGLLVLSGEAGLWHMVLIAVAHGVVTAFDHPARLTFVSDLVSSENASNAVALNAASMNVARLVGPATAGILIVAVGPGWVFLGNALTFSAMIAVLVFIRPVRVAAVAEEAVSERPDVALTRGVRHVFSRPDLLVVLTVAFLIAAFGTNFPIFAATMAVEFGREADGFGILFSILAAGSLAGALASAQRERARLRMLAVGSALFALASVLGAVMPSYPLYATTLVLSGFAVTTTLTTANGYVQTTTARDIRGRVMTFYLALLTTGTMIGAPVAGAIAGQWGARWALVAAAASALAACAVLGASWLLGERRRSRLPLPSVSATEQHVPTPGATSTERG